MVWGFPNRASNYFSVGELSATRCRAGFILFLRQTEVTRYLGQTVLGLVWSFTGLNILPSVLKPLACNLLVRGAILQFADQPVIGYTIGALASSLVQSNAAAISLLQTLAGQPVIEDGLRTAFLPLSTTLPFVFGTNLEVCATGAFVSLKSGVQAKRAVLAQWLMNLTTFALVLMFFAPFRELVGLMTNILWQFGEWVSELFFLSPPRIFPQGVEVISRQIAVAHTLYNLLLTVLWLPFLNPVNKVMNRFFNGNGNRVEDTGTQFLNYNMLHNPSVALRLASKEILRMADLTMDMLSLAQTAFVKGSLSSVHEVRRKEDLSMICRTKSPSICQPCSPGACSIRPNLNI